VEKRLSNLILEGNYSVQQSTLLSQGESFFSGLLSSQIPSTKDENGNYFIDRSSAAFEVILEFLRSYELYIPDHLSHQLLLREARFYMLTHLEKSIMEVNSSTPQAIITSEPPIRQDGYYYNKTSEIPQAICFNSSQNSVVFSRGDGAVENLIVFKQVTTLPIIWESVKRTYAEFIQHAIRRGKYWVEGRYFRIQLSQLQETSLFGVAFGSLFYSYASPLNIMSRQGKFVEWTFSEWPSVVSFPRQEEIQLDPTD